MMHLTFNRAAPLPHAPWYFCNEIPDVVIVHCGHPTALYPYYIAQGNRRVGPTFKTSKLAKEWLDERAWIQISGPSPIRTSEQGEK